MAAEALQLLTDSLACASLTSLDWSGNAVSPAALRSLSRLRRLRALSLSKCSVRSNAATGLSVALRTLSDLSRLDLSCNGLSSIGIAAVVRGLAQLPALQYAHLGWGQPRDAAAARRALSACAAVEIALVDTCDDLRA
jgi:Ran GTPase-activating protein (RanGAP) involved in mRNA processing and transport